MQNPINKRKLSEDALNAACLSIQEALGIKTGDTAGVFFSGRNREAFHRLFNEYIDLELSIADDETPDFPEKGFVVWETAGGCCAYVKVLADNRHVVVTDENGQLPESGDKVVVGIYPSKEWYAEEGAVKTFDSRIEALDFITMHTKPYQAHCPEFISAVPIDPATVGFVVDQTKLGDVHPVFATLDNRWRLEVSWDNPKLVLGARGVQYDITWQSPETGQSELVFCGSPLEVQAFTANPHWNLADIDTNFLGRLDEFDAIELQGVRDFNDPSDASTCIEPDNVTPQFFSVYLHLKAGGVECIADFGHLWMAQQFADALGAKHDWRVGDHTAGQIQKLELELLDDPVAIINPAYRMILPGGQHYAYITNDKGTGVPQYPEIEVIRIGIYTMDGNDILFLDLAGRIGLNLWYEEHVGYQPDEDDIVPNALTALVKDVVEMAFRHTTGYDN